MINYLWFFIGGEDIAHMVQANRQIFKKKEKKKTLKIGSNFSLIFIKWFLIVPFEKKFALYLFSNLVTIFIFFSNFHNLVSFFSKTEKNTKNYVILRDFLAIFSWNKIIKLVTSRLGQFLGYHL
jgi:hypothetical protein